MEKNSLYKILKEKILILDGAMGTMIQRHKLQEEDYRGERFKEVEKLQKGNNDLLCLTQPEIIENIYRAYLEAGADIIETNSFNATTISMEDYGMEQYAKEINIEAAKIAKKAADDYTKQNPNKPRFVAGAIGPTNKTASISPKVENPIFRAITFDDLKKAYKEQAEGLIEGGIDVFLVETIFDTLNAKASLFAIEEVKKERNLDIPIMISVTLSDKAGRTLSGQTIGAFLASINHINYLSVGLNCSFGASDMKPFLKELARLAPSYISAYPNAGLPNQFGEYDETPEIMAVQIKEFIEEGLVNILGGCCGTTPEHIAKYLELTKDAKPHIPAPKPAYMWLSGLELLEAKPEINFINVGERCNVAGSRKFLRLIKEKKYEEALQIATKQVEDGAQILDVNMDEGLLDGAEEMTTFLNLVASDPDVSRIPIMIDSSKWEVIEAGLKCVQGKAVVNSISLKEGEKEFLHHARLIRSYGAATIVMAFDEVGQADTFERRIEICERAYKLLVNDGFDPKDIIFDPNILAIATGIEEHRNYAVDFLKTITWIKEHLPHAKISGGVSNLSFSLRGNDYIREVMHSVFLYYAIQRGMDMGIVNPGQSVIYDDIPTDLRNLVEDVIFNKRAEATEELIEYAEKIRDEKVQGSTNNKKDEWRSLSLDERLSYSLVKGISDYLEEDLAEALKIYDKAVDIIDKPLMNGMNRVGELFGSGKMFLPQVVKTARTMKRAVAILQPVLESQKAEGSKKNGKLLIATVKGDVHDIGKNIVSIILACNNYEMIDLGVMTPPEVIIQKIKEIKPDIVCLSGLITPSLEEMSVVAKAMQKEGFNMPLMIGGATTSKLHTAIKISPNYESGPVVYVKDASQAPAVVAKLVNPSAKDDFIKEIKEEYTNLAANQKDKKEDLVSYDVALKGKASIDWDNYISTQPKTTEKQIYRNIPIAEIIPFIDWKFFFHSWNLSARYASIHHIDNCPSCKNSWLQSFPENEREKAEEGAKLYKDANALLDRFVKMKANFISVAFGVFEAYSEDECIFIDGKCFPMLRQQKQNTKNQYLSLADYVRPKTEGKTDYIGAFTVSAGLGGAEEMIKNYEDAGDEYTALLMKSVLDRLAEATTEWLHHKLRTQFWGFTKDESLSINEMFTVKYRSIRPAVGYPSIPDQSINFILNQELLHSDEIGVSLTENGVMFPNATVSGIIIAHPDARYFGIGKIDEDQAKVYIKHRGLAEEVTRKFLAVNLD